MKRRTDGVSKPRMGGYLKHEKSDILWKVVMEEVFEDLLRFVFPDADKVYDLERGFEFLDKELAEMDPDPAKRKGTKFADKLVKVFNREGLEEWVLCHVEVQGYTKAKERPLFAARMFRYFIRIWDKHQKPVSAIAIFTGSDAKKMPARFEYGYRDTRVRYDFRTVSILDFTDDELEKSNNPFAQVVLVARTALLEQKMEELDLLELKILIATKLLNKGFAEKKIRAILVFLEDYIFFKEPEMNRIFIESIQSQDKNNVMGIDEYLKQKAMEEGLEKGLEKGLEEGREKGREEGRKEEREKNVKHLLASTEFSVTKIAELLDVPVSFVKKVKESLQPKLQAK
jgi:predicted transposase YdaD